MPFTTLASGLTIQIPTPGTKNWATTLQDQCWQKISEHDHTGSGKGKQIGTNALAALAVTSAKIANLTVVAGNIADATITSAKLDADAATRSTQLYNLEALGITDGTAAIAEYAFRRPMPKAGKVTHITANIQQASGASITGGTLTFTLYKNGVTTGKTVALTTGESYDVSAIAAESFVAGDRLSVALTKAGVTMTAGSQFFEVILWGHFTV